MPKNQVWNTQFPHNPKWLWPLPFQISDTDEKMALTSLGCVHWRRVEVDESVGQCGLLSQSCWGQGSCWTWSCYLTCCWPILALGVWCSPGRHWMILAVEWSWRKRAMTAPEQRDLFPISWGAKPNICFPPNWCTHVEESFVWRCCSVAWSHCWCAGCTAGCHWSS